MGADAVIRFKLKEGGILPDLTFFEEGDKYNIIEEVEESEYGETHDFYNLMRYYGEGYDARGPWPYLLSIILTIMESESVEKVWYGGDTGGVLEEMTKDRIAEITNYWIDNGNRPYHRK